MTYADLLRADALLKRPDYRQPTVLLGTSTYELFQAVAKLNTTKFVHRRRDGTIKRYYMQPVTDHGTYLTSLGVIMYKDEFIQPNTVVTTKG